MPFTNKFARDIMEQKYAHTKADGSKETWDEVVDRVAWSVCVGNTDYRTMNDVRDLIRDRKFMPGGRYLYASGRPFHQTQNCLLLRADDSREGWADLMQKATMALMTGAGIGVDYSDVRAEGSHISRTGGKSTGPLALMQMVNEAGRHIMQGGARRSAIWAGLRWNHPDVLKFVKLKDWSPEVRALKENDFNFPATLDGTNISVILDRDFFDTYYCDGLEFIRYELLENGSLKELRFSKKHAHQVYWAAVKNMLETGEPGFSVDYNNARESLRNACTEVVSEDDSDICNLGSLNLARFDTLDEFTRAVELATTFLLAGTLYSHVPYQQVDEVRTKNRRLGLGLMGIHEWLLKRGKAYGPDEELGQWLDVYRDVSDRVAKDVAASWGISAPVAVRAVAPTGTIGIVAETTTGIEPIFCVAYMRRYKGPDGHTTQFQYVVDPTAKQLIDSGIAPDTIEDAYTLAEDPERRVAFQAWLQQYVDMSISSTINLPEWGSSFNNETRVQAFGEMLLKYLPKIRGITVYPDGARGGQPLSRVTYAEAAGQEGQVFVEGADICDISKAGSC